MFSAGIPKLPKPGAINLHISIVCDFLTIGEYIPINILAALANAVQVMRRRPFLVEEVVGHAPDLVRPPLQADFIKVSGTERYMLRHYLHIT